MADIHIQRAGALFAQNIARQQKAQIQQGITGKKYDDGTVLLRGSSANGDLLTDGRIYVRLRNGLTKPAWNMTTALEVNIPVWIDRNPKGQYRVIGLIEDEGYAQFGSGAAAKNSPSTAINDIIYANRIGPGRPKLFSASGAIGASGLVIVVDDFTYVDSTGALRLWTANSGTLDLTSSVPASGLHTLALVALNPAAAAPALTITTLADRAISWPFTSTDYGSFSLTAGYVPLFAYELRNGDTTFLASRCDYNVRLFLSAYRPPNARRVTDTATDYTIVLSDETICVTDTTIARTITLPAAADAFASGFGRAFTVADKSGGAATNNISLAAAGGDTVLGTGVISTNYGNLTAQAVSATEFLIL